MESVAFMDKRKQNTRDRIRKAYLDLLSEYNHHKLTVTALAKQANIDRKTFYLHYDTMDDVMMDCSRQVINRLVEILEMQNFFQQRFNAMVFYQALGKVVCENMTFFQYIATLPNMDFFWEQSKNMITENIIEMCHDKVSVDTNVLEVYIRFLLAGMQEVYREWLRGNLRFSLEELGRISSDISFEGFCTILK